MKSKIFAIMLAVLMVVSIFPLSVAAATPVEVGTTDAFINALADDVTIKLTNSIDFSIIANQDNGNIKYVIGGQYYWPKNVTVDLNGNTITWKAQNQFFTGNSKIIDGDINFDYDADGDCYIGVGGRESEVATLTLEGVNVTGNNYCSSFAAFYVYEYNADNLLEIIDCTFDLSNEKSPYAGVIKALGGGDIYIENSEFDFENVNTGISALGGSSVEIAESSVINIADSDVGIRAEDLIVSNSDITITNSSRGLYLLNSCQITDSSNVVLSDNSGSDIYMYNDSFGDITIDESSLLKFGTARINNSSNNWRDHIKPSVVGENGNYNTPYDVHVTFDANGGKMQGNSSKIVGLGTTYGELPKVTKRGNTFISWAIVENGDINYVDENTPVENLENHTLVAIFDQNELGNTEILPRLFDVKLSAGEGGTVEGFSGNKTLMVAFGASRTIDFVADEGYEIKNVNVNGYNLGAIDTYKIIGAYGQYNIAVEFAEIIEETTPDQEAADPAETTADAPEADLATVAAE